MDGILCDSPYPFNVKTHDAIHRFFDELPININNVRCNHCSKHIGEKFIVVGDTDPPLPRPYALEGRVFFYSDRLLFWNGTRMVGADSDELVKRLVFFDGTQLHYCEPYQNEETDDEKTEFNYEETETKTDEEDSE
ncbi:hypothetical protein V6N13_094422 [Hibiscus sabdariffa]|uniref:Yippee domain-containing protein n=1 Tax=Hibiscus sabdariffa TaxID=183260 RepID=A0ABR2PPZ3_9ROSI